MADSGAPLPPGWTEHVYSSKDGPVLYYYHAATGVSSWERPIAPLGEDASRVQAGDGRTEEEGGGKRIKLEGDDGHENDDYEMLSGVAPERRRALLDEKKIRLAENLSTRDQILDKKAFRLLHEWIETITALAEINDADANESLSKSASQAAKLLADSYDGCGDQATLLSGWYDLIAGKDASRLLVTKKIKEIVSSSSTLIQKLNQLLVEHENPPAWLLSLLPDPDWRSFFLDIASKHSTEPFAIFCVRHLVEAGFHEEISQAITSTAYFSVFEKSFSNTLTQLVEACGTDGARREAASGLVNKIVQLAESSEQASFFCGQVLFDVEQNKELAPSTRFAAAHVRQRVQNFKMKLLHRGGLRTDCQPLASCLIKVMSEELDACEACVEIYEYYHMDPKPPSWPLYERDFLHRLVGGLFRPSRTLDQTHRTKACWVLATAATVKQGEKVSEHIEIETLVAALEKCSAICNSPDSITTLDQVWTELKPLCEDNTTCSIGVLYWIRALLLHNPFLSSHAFQSGFKTISTIAKLIGEKHALQRSHVFAVLKRALDTRPPADDAGLIGGTYLSDAKLAELAENVIDVMVDLMSKGFVIPILDHFIQQAPTLDLSLLRKFMVGVFEVADPPYSKTFKDKVQTLLSSVPGTKAAVGGGAAFAELKKKFLAGAMRH